MIALDGELALEQSQSTAPFSADQKSFDYLQVIRQRIRLYPLTFKFRQVSGHKTDQIVYDKLDWWGKTNDKMDSNAKTYMNACTTMAPVRVYSQSTFYIEKWSLTLDGNKLTCIDQNTLYDSLYRKRTLLYWHKKDNVSHNPADIMWEESRLAR